MTLYSPPLYSKNILLNRINRIQGGKTALETLLEKITKCLPQKMMHLAQNCATISPWGLYCVYRAAVVCMQLSRESEDSDAVENLTLLKQMLSIVKTRWSAAGT
jgi:hypothetical protein